LQYIANQGPTACEIIWTSRLSYSLQKEINIIKI